MARWVNLDDCVEISVGEMNFYPVELLGDVYEDVAPVVHAHWRWMLNHDVICSKCQYVLPSGSPVSYFRFCPNCAAKMDEEVDDE